MTPVARALEAAAEAVAKSLSEAQKEALLRQPCRSWWGDLPACMPHRKRTGVALTSLGLCMPYSSSTWPLTPLGVEVRAIINAAAVARAAEER